MKLKQLKGGILKMKTIGILAIVMLIGSMFAFPVSALSYANPADVNNDGYVDKTDLEMVFRNWGPCKGSAICVGDVNSDGKVNVEDMTAVILAWDPNSAPKEPKNADLDGDGMVGSADLSLLMQAWGECGSYDCPADLDHSMKVDHNDLNILMRNWTVETGEQANWNEISKDLDNVDEDTLKKIRRAYYKHYLSLKKDKISFGKEAPVIVEKYERPSFVPAILSDKAPEERPERPYIQTPKPVEKHTFRVPTILSNIWTR
jgi:Ca2+-binding EF-hand superfamily protein